MIDRWWAEAEANDVLPLDSRPFSVRARTAVVGGGITPALCVLAGELRARERRRQHPQPSPHGPHVHTGGAPVGVLVSQGSVLGGWSFHVVGGRLCFVHNLAG
jgi:hypothetical protein